MYRLLIEDDEGRTTIVPLIRNQINIGREEGNTIRLTERNVSRRHARLALKDGQIIIEDLQSYNGVWINGNRVEASISVNPGDLMEIGDYHLSIQEEATDVERKARPSLPPDQNFDEQTPPLGVPPLGSGEEGTSSKPSRLVVINTSLAGREFLLNKGEMTIGRTDDNDICIDHASVSRNHAKIVQQGEAYQLLDLGSANGIQVNGEEYGVCDLRWGDILELGQVRLRFTSPDAPREVPLAVQETTAVPAPASRASTSSAAPSGKSNMPLIMGVVVLLLLAAGGAWFLLSSPPVPDKSDAGLSRRLPPPPAQDDLTTREGQRKMFARAEDAWDREAFDETLQIVIKLLNVRKDWAQAIDLKKRTIRAKRDHKLLNEAKALISEDDLVGAHDKLKPLLKGSRYTTSALKLHADLLPKLITSLMDKAQLAKNQDKLYEAQSHAKQVLKYKPDHEGAKAFLEGLKERIHKGKTRRPVPTRRAGSPLAPPLRPLRRRRRRRPRKRRPRKRRPRKRRPVKRAKAPAPRPAAPGLSGKALCKSYYKQKKVYKAYKCYNTWTKRNPKDANAKAWAGTLASRLGNCNHPNRVKQNLLFCYAAKRHYKAYLQIAPNGPSAARIRRGLIKRRPN